MNLKHLLAGGIVALSLSAASSGGLSIGAAQAAPAPVSAAVAATATTIAPSAIDPVQFRRGFGYRPYAYRRGYGWRGPGVWLGLGAAMAAGWIIYDRAYLPRRGYYYDTGEDALVMEASLVPLEQPGDEARRSPRTRGTST